MEDQKIENLLNLALSVTPNEREKSLNLNVGFDQEEQVWDLIIKYQGDVGNLQESGVTLQPLLGEYAIVTIPQSRISAFADRREVIFVEKPKRLFFSTAQGSVASCIPPVRREPLSLTGQGVLVGIVDSGIDYRHPDFLDDNGESRILRLWDQTIAGGTPPAGYALGSVYTQEQLSEAAALPAEEGYRLVPSRDLSGHGTQVAGIAAGNGRASGGLQRGVAYESPLAVVKLGTPRKDSFPRTTELMLGVDYLVRLALELGMPLALNLSFGNNYGSHRGDSLVETYLDNVSNVGRTVICAGTGNNAAEPLHVSGELRDGDVHRIELGVSTYERAMNLQIWKSYADQIEISLVHPSGQRIGPFYEELGPQEYQAGTTRLLVYYGEPSPFMVSQEIYVDFVAQETYVDAGVWIIELRPRVIKNGQYRMWLPGGGVLNRNTGFYLPTPYATLTIPSTASRLVTVAAYDSRSLAYADFSGRGFQEEGTGKPDVAAPGVNITTTVVGGSYGTATGTSFATPFVTGAAALLMEYGIVRGNDPFLYGEKVKAYLRRGARPLPGFAEYPNEQVGYGALCVRESLPR